MKADFLILEDWWQKIKGCATVTLVVRSKLFKGFKITFSLKNSIF